MNSTDVFLGQLLPSAFFSDLAKATEQSQLLAWAGSAAAVLLAGLLAARLQPRAALAAAIFLLALAYLSDELAYRSFFPRLCAHSGYYMNQRLRRDVTVDPRAEVKPRSISNIREWSGALEIQTNQKLQTDITEVRLNYLGGRWRRHFVEAPLRGLGGTVVVRSCKNGNISTK